MKKKVAQLSRLAALCCLLLGLAGFNASAQSGSITVKGKVIDGESQTVIGAAVTIKGTNTGVGTDMDGAFTIKVPGESTVLEVACLGYITQEVKVGKQRNITIVLADDTQSLEATVVVAYGTQTKATITGALTTIDSKALVKAPVADVTNVLAGQMPGVSTVQDNGQPGEDYAKIFIRGVSSLDDAFGEPLILVDGVQRPLNTVDPNEIASLSILKDAASTAVFGVRGANGVIIVTTKRGDTGKPKISVSSITGLQQPMSYVEQVGSYEYATMWNIRMHNDGETDPKYFFSKEAIEAYRTGSDPIMYPSTHWADLMFRKFFLQTKNNVNISGGSEKVRYFISMGYMYQNGMLKQIPGLSYDNNYAYNRYNYRANLDFKLTETTDMHFNISGVIGDTREPISQVDNLWIYTLLWAQPFSSPGIINGIPLTTVEKLPGKAIPSGPTPYSGYNPIYNQGYQNKYKTSLNVDLVINQKLDFITEGLSAGFKGGYDTNLYIYKKHVGGDTQKQKISYVGWHDGKDLDVTDPDFDKTYQLILEDVDGPLSYSDSKRGADKSWYLEGRIDYSRKFDGKHAVSALLLYNQSRDYYPDQYSYLPQGYVGFVGRVTYGYKDKYLVDISAGYNGSENFAPGKTRYGFFPSISLGYVVSEEKFIKKSLPWLNYLKLRASAGKVGSDLATSTRFMYMQSVWSKYGDYNFGNTNKNGVPFYTTGTPGNEGVTWETALKYNAGLDFDILDNRLHFSGDIFQEHRTGILLAPKTTPSIIATSLPMVNKGAVDNHGYEMEVSWKDHVGDFTYDIGANVTFARNKIIFKDEVLSEFEYQNETGGSTGRNTGLYEFIRLYQYDDFYTDDDGNLRLKPEYPQPSAMVYPGDCMFADKNGDNVINGDDQMVYGYPSRPEYVFGSNWKFGYKGFNLALNWVAATNVTRMLDKEYRYPFTNSGNRGLFTYFWENCWTEEHPERTLPRASMNSKDWNGAPSTLWLRDASYIRLKSASFGYTFGRNKFFDKMGIGSMSLMFTGYNLLTFTPMDIQDPEAVTDNDGKYPLVKTYNLALNINF